MSLIKQIHDIINFATDKGVTGYHDPEDIDNEIHAVSTDLWQEFYDEYARTRKISSYMTPFLVEDNDLAVSSGKVVMTKAIEHPVSMNTDTGKSVKICEPFQWDNHINDPVAPPTDDYPVAKPYSRDSAGLFTFQIYPETINRVNVVGLRLPKKPKYTYTIDSNGRVVFDSSLSGYQDIEWSELLFNDIRNRVLKIMGINLREPAITQFAERLQVTDTE